MEDDPGVQELLRHVLASEGYEVAVARDAASMRAAFAAGSFDVAVLDIGLPGRENGLALAREISDTGCGVALITGHHAYDGALAESGYPYLLKPFRVEALLATIENVLQAMKARCAVPRRQSGN